MQPQRRTLLEKWKQLSGYQQAVILSLAVLVLWLVITTIGRSNGERPIPKLAPSKPSPARASSELNASVSFNGKQFIIKNADSYDWSNVRLEVNGGIISGGYQLRQDLMKAGETYTVGAMQFADSDGKRFNPFQMKAQKFRITASVPGGSGYYIAEWE